MKRIKRIASLLLALVMVIAMALPVMAADNNTHKITVTQNAADKTEHTYDAYQIFKGDLAEKDGKKVLSNIEWGAGVNGDALLAALKADNTFNVVDEGEAKTNAFANCKTAAQVAEVLGGEAFGSSDVENSTLTDAFARVAENKLTATVAGTATGTGNVEITVTGSGYYLVKDQNGTVDTTNGAYTRFMLEVVGDATATVKSDVPSGDKKVYIDGSTTGDANNASIGSHVSYEITSKVPNHVGYNYYYFIMNDTLSEGLTFDGASSVAVKVGDVVLVQGKDYYVYTENVAPKTFRLAFADIMKYDVGKDIVVTYSATVNDKAVVGTTGNPNTWNLQYSNNPDDTFDGERPDGENTPGLPADEENEALGQTPDEKTLTYVTELDITKYANSVAEDHLLAGAEFTLTGTSKQVVLNTVDYYEASENGTYYLLLNGTYTETAPTGTEYVEIGVGTADTTTGYIKDADGKYFVPTDKTAYEGATLYKLVKGTASDYADVNTKYVKKTATETTYVDADVSIELTTGPDGKISFKDLGAGTYTLTETVTPEGFNTLEPIDIVISFRGPEVVNTGDEPGFWAMTWNGESIEGGETGIFAQDVINNSGSLLPSTGGIGTTIFYVVGAILVIGAGVMLVVKKRMSREV
ncbi:fimbrial isopeptide formation D2 domain-containing protein [Dorea sp. 5-2]|nr:fimbrial isopeptide formation D2 domain-containing protein [Dorea sp. 5-2]